MSVAGPKLGDGDRALAACFSLSRDLPRARVAAESFRRWHPEVPCFAVGLDEDGEPWQAVALEDLGVGDIRAFSFRHAFAARQEACRPRLIRALFAAGFRRVMSFAGSVEIVGSFEATLRALETTPMCVLGEDAGEGTPPVFWVGRFSAATDAMLERWQRWSDDVADVAEEASLGERLAEAPDLRIFAAASLPLVDFDRPARPISWLDPAPELLLEARARRRHAEAVAAATRAPSAAAARDLAATFDDGLEIPELARSLHRGLGDAALAFGDPFRGGGAGSFRAWLDEPIDDVEDPAGRLTRFWHATWERSATLRERFPRVRDDDRGAFLSWVADEAARSQAVSERFVRRRVRHPERARRSLRSYPFGVDLAGALESEKGVGEAVRSLARSLRSAGIPFAASSHRDHGSRNLAAARVDAGDSGSPYAISLVCVNAENVSEFIRLRGVDYFAGRHNVAHWVWETPEFPRRWEGETTEFDELWTPSSFVTDALREVSSVPVHTIPYSLHEDVPPDPPPSLGIPPDVFLFAFAFDFASCQTRKNPLGLVQAFRRAFGARRDVALLLKCAHSEFRTEQWTAVLEEARRCNVRISDVVLDRPKMLALLERVDCYVSLHRSEGFGLTLAEAMSFGKPVIATGYSGNMDFMSAETSLLVGYTLVPVKDPWGPYRSGYVWAEPDLEQAAESMRWVVEHREAAKQIGERARVSVRRMLDPAVIGRRVAERLRLLSGTPAKGSSCVA